MNERPEGVYVTLMSGPAGHEPVQIERVCGDGSVKQLIVAHDEARELIDKLAMAMTCDHRFVAGAV